MVSRERRLRGARQPAPCFANARTRDKIRYCSFVCHSVFQSSCSWSLVCSWYACAGLDNCPITAFPHALDDQNSGSIHSKLRGKKSSDALLLPVRPRRRYPALSMQGLVRMKLACEGQPARSARTISQNICGEKWLPE